ncbi:MAG: energy transducer TonB [Luteimonas sp.]
MSTPAPRNDGPTRLASWRPSRRVLLLAGIAFAIGLLLFLLLWWSDRDNDFYRAGDESQTAEGQQFEPLPAPLPADESSASGMRESDNDAAGSGPRIVETSPAPVAPPLPPAPPSPPDDIALAPGSTPVPIESPAPRYPRDALRHGESGTVLLRVHVGPDGVPYAVDLVQSSRSRSLDRAASDAVKRWRFRPAQRDGQPVAGEVQVPISFNADR